MKCTIGDADNRLAGAWHHALTYLSPGIAMIIAFELY